MYHITSGKTIEGEEMKDYDLFKALILKKTGIDLSLYKEKQMKRRIKALAARKGFNKLTDYYRGIDKERQLHDEFLNYITINVSEFFRNPTQWDVLQREIVPLLIENKKNKGNIRVWSCACSTGEEPYTLVMLFSQFPELEGMRVFATDIDEGAMEKAKAGVYKENSLKNLTAEQKKEFFQRNGNDYKINDAVKEKVDFKKLDLLRDNFPSQCDLVVCRNVLIYFTEQAKQLIYRKLGNILTDNGVLFVGSTEQIIMPQKYNFTPMKVFFYMKSKKKNS